MGAHLTLDIDDDCDSDHTKVGVTAGRPSAGTESAQANFKFTNLDPNGCNANTASWTKCVKMFAVRSMGYYLGFADEESVSGEGNNIPCPDGHQETVRAAGDTSVSTANGQSVMSLCHAFPKADSYQLSSGDINGVKAAYGGGGNVVAGTRYALRFTSNEGSWKGRYLSVDNWGSESKIRTSLINPERRERHHVQLCIGQQHPGRGRVDPHLQARWQSPLPHGPLHSGGLRSPVVDHTNDRGRLHLDGIDAGGERKHRTGQRRRAFARRLPRPSRATRGTELC
jgi:hypothetical protein